MAQRVQFAYLLEEVGMISQAENIFVAAAGNQTHDSFAVTELLGFWEDHPSSIAREWVESRARNSSSAERVGWLTTLNDLGYSQSVIALLHNDWYSSSAVADQYITALVATHDSTKLNEAFTQAIASESNPARLRQLATIADEEDIFGASETAWHKLHQISPNDPDATLQLGMIAYDGGRYDEAEPFLGQYLQHNQGTYQINYAYGDILQQSGKTSSAEPYFERALHQLADIQDKSIEITIDEGTLLFYTGKTQQAMGLFRHLIANNPKNKDIRAEYAELLMKMGQFEEASKLLTQ
jgi:tetratricopeptide (TPR) repeat protein